MDQITKNGRKIAQVPYHFLIDALSKSGFHPLSTVVFSFPFQVLVSPPTPFLRYLSFKFVCTIYIYSNQPLIFIFLEKLWYSVSLWEDHSFCKETSKSNLIELLKKLNYRDYNHFNSLN